MVSIKSLKADVVDPSIPVSTILLKAKVIAHHLNNKEFQDWVEYELNGYPRADGSLPVYRHIPCNSIGNFVGPFRKEIRNIAIPNSILPEEMRPYTSHLNLTEPISSFEIYLEESDHDMGIPWPGDWVRTVYRDILDGYSLMSAWKPVSKATMRSVIDSVRSRFLDFVLELEKQSPENFLDDDVSSANLEGVSSLVQTVIYGGSQVIAAGVTVDQTVVQIQEQITDLLGLFEQIRTMGVPDNAIKELEDAVESDGNRTKEEGFGEGVKSWFARVIQKIGSGIWEITTETVPVLVAKFLSNYYGWQ